MEMYVCMYVCMPTGIVQNATVRALTVAFCTMPVGFLEIINIASPHIKKHPE